ncbi:MAG TPA: CPBP family intramembrane glutamic endopeptidase [Flavobacteriaceae bacterium]|nr:CPBP family intramembrane glutamic endopeptidase [Flavobacteriaceae bacterium]
MFIENAYKGKTDFWRYIVGIVCVIFGVIVGQLPWTLAILVKEGFSIAGKDETYMMQVLDKNLNLFLLLLSFAVGLGALFLVIRLIHQQKIKDVTTVRKKIDWKRFFFAFSLIGAFSIITTGIDFYFSPEDYVLNFRLAPFLVLCLIAIVMIPLQTSFEEYLFRGYLMQGLGVLAKNRWFPLITTSIIFGGLHFFNPEVGKLGNSIMFYYIGTGFLLGIMTLMDDGMELALGFHAGNNLIGALLVTADWTAFQTNSVLIDISDPTAGLDIMLPTFIFYTIFLFILAKKYHWKNWGEKLFGRIEKPEEETLPNI